MRRRARANARGTSIHRTPYSVDTSYNTATIYSWHCKECVTVRSLHIHKAVTVDFVVPQNLPISFSLHSCTGGKPLFDLREPERGPKVSAGRRAYLLYILARLLLFFFFSSWFFGFPVPTSPAQCPRACVAAFVLPFSILVLCFGCFAYRVPRLIELLCGVHSLWLIRFALVPFNCLGPAL
ncbi:uncharacterized protein BO80DRAFT_206940 [Aspergillus ibericus CBS 121593]|uniref:Uncharacterized protein n=1 Tax=Aspergillus ibericus CBS 121593 TaxID=1448316 RepID=A0A395H9W5_9EURO|nr:hypothetical protein BO80DRAFT_206940 [Aspergillus ibericus CBS 121593]RAL04707.1 hypothetical protein BO80DRAFT_206940 [Aspergillus ibericus CBS 121593]